MPTDLSALRAALPSALVALDFDGTLAPVSPHPDDARPVAGVQRMLRDVRATGAALAVVTGRSVASLLRVSGFGAVPGIVIYGLHGVERWENGKLRAPATPGRHRRAPAEPAGDGRRPGRSRGLDRGQGTVARRAHPAHRRAGSPGRGAAGAGHRRRGRRGLEVRPGKEVLEIVIPGTDKGTAIRELTSERTAAMLYAGDDVGDVPAVAEMRAWSDRSGRPALAVAISAAGAGPSPAWPT